MGIYLGSNLIDTKIVENKDDVNAFIEGTINFSINNLSGTLRAYTYERCSNLINVSFPNCTSIDVNAFAQCSALTTVNFPNCSVINGAYNAFGSLSGAFYNCSALTSVSFPKCTLIGSCTFEFCIALTEVNFPSCTRIYDCAFANCSALTSISFPQCTSIGTYNGLLTGGRAFGNCSALTEVNFPSCSTIGSAAFQSCISLSIASFPICTKIDSTAFSTCYNLISLYLNSVSQVTTLGSSVFYSTPIGGYSASAGRYGSVFVPASLYNDFIVASYWSDIADRIVSV